MLDFIRIVLLLVLLLLVLRLLLLPLPPPPVSPRPCLHQLAPCQLFAKLFAICQLPSSVRTAGPQSGTFPAQCAPLDFNLGPSKLSVHRWTSTWDLPSSVCNRWTSTCDLPSSVCTAGPQPGTFPAQCAPLDLNRGPAQLSVHRWTSTWDLPSSVCTAGPQPGTFSSVCTAGPQRQDRMPDKMP